MKKIILSSNKIDCANKGCEALAYSTLYVVRSVLDELNISADIYIAEKELKSAKSEYVVINNRKYYFKRVSPPKFNIFGLAKLILKPKAAIRAIKVYCSAKCMLDIGAGDSFSDIYGKKRFQQIYNNYILARIFKLKVCVLPQTIGPFANKDIETKAIKALNQSSFILFRDKQSYKYISDKIKSKYTCELLDIAFLLPYNKKKFQSNRIHVGLNVSALLWNGGYTNDNQFNLREDYRNIIKLIIDLVLKIDNVALHIVPHVVEDKYSIENDYAVAHNLYDLYNSDKIVISPLFFDPISAKGYIAGLDFFMGSRMHSTIAAFSAGVPVLPLAYSQKFNGLFNDSLDYKYMVDLTKESESETLDKVSYAFENRRKLQDLIDERLKGVVADNNKLLIEKLKLFLNNV